MDFKVLVSFCIFVSSVSSNATPDDLSELPMKKVEVLTELINYWMQEAEQLEQRVEKYKVTKMGIVTRTNKNFVVRSWVSSIPKFTYTTASKNRILEK
jgi:hypothetical protein